MRALVTTLALHRHAHIFERGQGGDQVVHLEHEAHGPGAETVQIVLPGQIVPVDDHLARGRLVQRADQVEQRRFAAAAGPHHGHKLGLLNAEVHVIQRAHFFAIAAVDFGEAQRLDDDFVVGHGKPRSATR